MTIPIRSSIAAEMLALAACWHGDTATGSKQPTHCIEGGGQLAIRICQQRTDLTFRITNRKSEAVWSFLAPATANSEPSLENAFAEMADGSLVLRKMQPPPTDGEQMFQMRAVLLEAGASVSGTIPLGTRLDTSASNLVVGTVTGDPRIRFVLLEVGWLAKRPTDTVRFAGPLYAIDVELSRQQIERSPVLSWH